MRVDFHGPHRHLANSRHSLAILALLAVSLVALPFSSPGRQSGGGLVQPIHWVPQRPPFSGINDQVASTLLRNSVMARSPLSAPGTFSESPCNSMISGQVGACTTLGETEYTDRQPLMAQVGWNVSRNPSWEKVAAHRAPPAVIGDSMAYDPRDGYVLMFGGEYVSNSTLTDSTWEFSNGSWTQLFPAVLPPPLVDAAMTYDTLDGYVLLFGGDVPNKNGSGFDLSSETWEFKSGNWSELALKVHPSARDEPAMTYDPVDEAVILFGGSTPYAAWDTWEFDRGEWTNLSLAHNPGPRIGGAMTFDNSDGYVLFFGGWNNTTNLNDTWKFLGGVWTELHPTPSPPPFTLNAFEYDPLDKLTVLFGGFSDNYTQTNSTWVFQSGNWTKLSPRVSPEARGYMEATFDAADQLLLFYGGWKDWWDGPNAQVFNDTWVWTAPLLELDSNRGSADVGELLNVSVAAQSPSANFTYAWTASPVGNGCTYSPNASIQCTPTLPGNYTIQVNVTDGAGASAVAGVSLSVLTILTTTQPAPSQSASDAGQTVTFSTSASGGTGNYPEYEWTGLTNCTSLTTSTVSCRFPRSALLEIRVDVTDTNNFTSALSPALPFMVHPGITTSTPFPSRATMDVGQNVTFSTAASGGSGVYVGYNWTNLSFGRCSASSTDLVTCQALVAGQFNISVRATDSLAGVSPPSSPLTFTVYPTLSVLQVQIEPDRAYVGDTIGFFSNVTGGSPGAQTTWSGLPSGCPNSSETIIACQVNTPGSYTVTTTTTDSDGAVVTAGPALLLVVNYPKIQYFVATPSHITLGGSVNFSIIMSWGVNPFAYTFRGLPDGCVGRDAVAWSCTPSATGTFTVGLIATDQLGGAAFGNVTITVTAPASSSILSGSSSWIYWAAIGVTAASLVAVATWIAYRRRERMSTSNQ